MHKANTKIAEKWQHPKFVLAMCADLVANSTTYTLEKHYLEWGSYYSKYFGIDLYQQIRKNMNLSVEHPLSDAIVMFDITKDAGYLDAVALDKR